MKKPSEILTIKAKRTFLLLPMFRAITIFGTIYCNRKKDVEILNATDSINLPLKCHETIHIKQAESTNDSWLKFYLLYLWQWICNLPLMWHGLLMPYRFIEFELEAYSNEDDYSYPNKGKAEQWRKFKKLSLKDKMELASRYKKVKRFMAFRKFVKNDVMRYL